MPTFTKGRAWPIAQAFLLYIWCFLLGLITILAMHHLNILHRSDWNGTDLGQLIGLSTLCSMIWVFIGFALWANVCGIACGSRRTMRSEDFLNAWAIFNPAFPLYWLFWRIGSALFRRTRTA